MSQTVEAKLIDAARALDDGRASDARAVLGTIPVVPHGRRVRPLHLALWRRVLQPDAPTAQALDGIEATFGAPDRIWSAYTPLKTLESEQGAETAAAIAGVALWNDVLRADPEFFRQFVELLCRGQQRENVQTVWRTFLTNRRDYSPDTWTLLSVLRLGEMQAVGDLRAAVIAQFREFGREDLLDLVGVQADFLRQAPIAATCAKALALNEPAHREIVADYLSGCGDGGKRRRSCRQDLRRPAAGRSAGRRSAPADARPAGDGGGAVERGARRGRRRRRAGRVSPGRNGAGGECQGPNGPVRGGGRRTYGRSSMPTPRPRSCGAARC